MGERHVFISDDLQFCQETLKTRAGRRLDKLVLFYGGSADFWVLHRPMAVRHKNAAMTLEWSG